MSRRGNAPADAILLQEFQVVSMSLFRRLHCFRRDERGGILVFWGVALVFFMGLLGLIFDFGRMATTQSELQSYADAVSLAAAAELDGSATAISRASNAAAALIADSQTYANGASALSANADVTLTYYRPNASGVFERLDSLKTTDAHKARFVETKIADRTISFGFGAAYAAIQDSGATEGQVGAQAVAGFSQEACNVAPVAVCLPSVDFDASASIGKTLELHTAVSLGNLGAGNIIPVDTISESLNGLQVCAGLNGGALDVCLIAARKPESACTGQGGLTISADVTSNALLESINTRLGVFTGVASSLANNANFAAAPNLLAGLTTVAGLCLPLPSLSTSSNIGLPADDCLGNGGCAVQGNGVWSAGRAAYVQAHYKGVDPHPGAQSRYAYYKAEIAGAVTPTPFLGGLLTPFVPKLCAPPTPATADRRLMVVAGIDCSGGQANGAGSKLPVQAYLEVFVLGPAKNGKLSVEVTACLGGDCGKGNLNTEIHDVVRLVE